MRGWLAMAMVATLGGCTVEFDESLLEARQDAAEDGPASVEQLVVDQYTGDGPAPLGTPCKSKAQCASGYCVEGVCCNNGCTGTCRTCKRSGSVGKCSYVRSGQDPRGDCKKAAPSTCGKDGACNGAGACRLYKQGTSCGPTKCVDKDDYAGQQCDGKGSCKTTAPTSCSPYRCDTTKDACFSSCASSSQCASGALCKQGTCQQN